jgi:hypothetical protein
MDKNLVGALFGLILIAIGTLSPHRSIANNDACWGDNSRNDISCVQLTETLLLSLRGKTKEQVERAMDAPGVERQANSLHFLSNYNRGDDSGSGDLNVTFEDGRATIINAMVDAGGNVGEMQFIWNAYAPPPLLEEFNPSSKSFTRPAFCSDLSGKPMRCNGGTVEQELMLSRMAFGSDKDELLEMLNAACNMPGMVVNDPNGDCERLRKFLR